MKSDVNIGGNVNIDCTLKTFNEQVMSTINSVSATTGALIVNGGVGIIKNVNVAGNITAQTGIIISTTNAIDITTGAFKVLGGVGITKDVYVGGQVITVTEQVISTSDAINLTSGALKVAGGVSVAKTTMTNNLIVMNTIQSTSTTTGAEIVYGGIGIGKDLYVGGIIHEINTTNSTSTDTGAIQIVGGIGIGKTAFIGSVNITQTTQSTSINSGSLIVSGGVGINNNTNIGGILNIKNTTDSVNSTTGSVIISGGIAVSKTAIIGNVKILDTSISTSITSGSLVVSGGVGINSNMYIGGQIVNLSTNNSTGTDNGSIVLNGGIGIAKDIVVGGNETIIGEINITNTTGSTSVDTGSIKTLGGAGIAGSVTIGGNTRILSSIESTSTTTGAVLVVGGVGIGGAMNIGDTLQSKMIIMNECLPSGSSQNQWTRIMTYISNQTPGTGPVHLKFVTPGTLNTGSDMQNGSEIVHLYLLWSPNNTFASTSKNIVFWREQRASNPQTDEEIVIAIYAIDIGLSSEEIRVYVKKASTNPIGIKCLVEAIDIRSDVFAFPGFACGTDAEPSDLSGYVYTKMFDSTMPNVYPFWAEQHIGKLVLKSDENSVDTETGAIVITGGMGIAKDVHVGGDLYTAGKIYAQNTESADSSDTGALQVSGGVGIGGKLYVANTITTVTPEDNLTTIAGGSANNIGIQMISDTWNDGGSVYYDSSHATVNIDILTAGNQNPCISVSPTTTYISQLENSTGTDSGALQVVGGLGVGMDVYIGGSLNTQTLNIITTTESISTTTGALTIIGGVGIGKNINVGGNGNISGVLTVNNTTNAVNTTSGSCIVSGGVGVAKDIHVGGSVVAIGGITNDEYSFIADGNANGAVHGLSIINDTVSPSYEIVLGGSANTTSGIGAGNLGIYENINNMAGITVDAINKQISINYTTQTTGTTTGSLMINGGIGVGKNMYLGGNAVSLSTIDSTNASSGSLITSGGIGIGGAINAYKTGGLSYYVCDCTGRGYTSITSEHFSGRTLQSGITKTLNYPTGTYTYGGQSAYYAMRIIGWIKPLYSETYTFTLTGDDLATLYINNTHIISVANTTSTGTIVLTANVWVPIAVEYINGPNSSSLRVQWQSTSQTIQDIPSVNMMYNQMTVPDNSLGTTVVNGTMMIVSTMSSTSTSSGAIVVKGGIGINENIYVGGNEIIGTNLFVGQDIESSSIRISTQSGVSYIQSDASKVVGGWDDIVISPWKSTTEYVRISDSYVKINESTETISTNSGALQVVGGTGIGKNLYVGGITKIVNTTPATNTSSGALNVAGGVGIGQNLYVGGVTNITTPTTEQMTIGYDATNKTTLTVSSGGNLTIDSSGNNINFANGDVVRILNTEVASSTTTGSVVVSGGIGISKQLYVGGTSNLYDQLNVTTANDFAVNVTCNKTGTTSSCASSFLKPALSAGEVYYHITGMANTTLNSSYYGFVYSGTLGSVNNYATFGLYSYDKLLNIYSSKIVDTITTASTSSSTGSLQIAGGVGIGKQLNVGGDARIYSTTQSTAKSTGALIVDGGMGIVGNLYCNDANVVSTSTNTIINSNMASSLTNGTYTSIAVGQSETNYNCCILKYVYTSSGSTSNYMDIGLLGLTDSAGIRMLGTGTTKIIGAIQSTDKTTGTLVVDGGVGINLNANIGGDLGINGTLKIDNIQRATVAGLNIASDTVLTINNTTDSLGVNSGSTIVNGGVGIGKNLYVGGTITQINTGDSYSYVVGGTNSNVGIKLCESNLTYYGNIYYGGTSAPMQDSINMQITANSVSYPGIGISSTSTKIFQTTSSTNYTTGSLVVSGGMGITGDIHSNDSIYIDNNAGVLQFSNTTLKKRIILYDAFVDTTRFYGFGIQSAELRYQVDATSSHHSFYTGTGSGTEQQLMKIEGDLGKSVNIYHTMVSTNYTTGALVVSGGMGIGGAINAFNTGSLSYYACDMTGKSYTTITDQFAGKILQTGLTTTLYYASGTYSFGGQSTYYAIRFIGWIKPVYTETYTFTLYADDCAVLYINNKYITRSVMANGTGTIALTANVWVPIIVEYMNGGGSMTLRLQWNSTSQTIQDIPSANMAYDNMHVPPPSLGSTIVNGLMSIIGTDTSSSTLTGAMTVIGGVGIGNNLNVGGSTTTASLTVAGTLTVDQIQEYNSGQGIDIVAGTKIYIRDTTDSGSVNTGALQVYGGASIAKQLYVGNKLTVATADSIQLDVSCSKTAVASGWTIATSCLKPTMGAGETYYHQIGVSAATLNSAYYGFVYSGTSGSTDNYASISLPGYNNLLNIYSDNITSSITTESTSRDTGTLQLLGGAGIAGSVYAGGNLGLNRNEEIVYMATFSKSIPDYPSDYGTITTNGSVSFTSATLNLSSLQGNFWRNVLPSAILPGSLGTIRFKYAPHYGSPTYNYGIISMGTFGSSSNKVLLKHMSSGDELRLFMYGTTYNMGAWSPTANQEYEIELNYNSYGTTRLFIDGVQKGSTINSSTARSAGDTIQCGSDYTDSAPYGYGKYRLVYIFNTIQHTSNYTVSTAQSLVSINPSIYTANYGGYGVTTLTGRSDTASDLLANKSNGIVFVENDNPYAGYNDTRLASIGFRTRAYNAGGDNNMTTWSRIGGCNRQDTDTYYGQMNFEILNNGTLQTIMNITDAGVIIGTEVSTSKSGAPLNVVSGVSMTTSYGYLNSSGNTGTSSGTTTYSIMSTYRIRCPEFNAVSDRRVKSNIVDFSDDISYSLVNRLVVKHYNRNDEPCPKIGFIAQEVEEVLPNCVSQVENGDIKDFRVLDHSQITAINTGAIKKVSKNVETLINENKLLREDNEKMKLRIEQLENKISEILLKLNT